MVNEILLTLSGVSCLVGKTPPFPFPPISSHLGLAGSSWEREKGHSRKKAQHGQRHGGVTVFLSHLLPFSRERGI